MNKGMAEIFANSFECNLYRARRPVRRPNSFASDTHCIGARKGDVLAFDKELIVRVLETLHRASTLCSIQTPAPYFQLDEF